MLLLITRSQPGCMLLLLLHVQADHPQGRYTSELPVQLLAHVLGNLGQQDVLQSCALVSSSWSTAAVLSKPEIHASLRHQGAACSLSRWLQAHAAAARISSITASAKRSRPCVQQLSALERLDLSDVSVSTQDYVSPSLACLAALPALTSLALSNFSMPLTGLPALTSLQQLKLESREEPLQGVALLSTLTALASLALSNFSMPLMGLPALTGLQQLKLDSWREPLQVALLSTLTALTSLQARCTITAGPGEPTLVVLTALTRLKHLQMGR
jgi:hypothetical protein